jgi:hypothetical protein
MRNASQAPARCARPLSVLSADGARTFVIIAPLATDHDDGVAVRHFGMGKIAIAIENDEQRFKPERGFEPAVSGHWILIGHCA